MFSINNKIKAISANILLGIFGLSIVFHLLVITGLLPNEIVWGGRISFKEELYLFEGISISINLFFIWIMFRYKSSRKTGIIEKKIRIFIWLMAIIFTLNTIGNLLAKSTTETIIFTPVTFISALCCLVLLSKEKS